MKRETTCFSYGFAETVFGSVASQKEKHFAPKTSTNDEIKIDLN
jgi:hypothetical protein